MHALIINSLFFLYLFNCLALTHFYVAGLPFRTLLLLIATLIILFSRARAIFPDAAILLCYVALAIIGTMSSLFNGWGMEFITLEIVRLAQAYLTICFCLYVLRVSGSDKFIRISVAVIALSALVGVLQYLGLGPAWQLRELLGAVQSAGLEQDAFIDDFVDEQVRAPGLALYAISQGYYLVIGFILCFYALDKQKRSRNLSMAIVNTTRAGVYWFAAATMFLAAVASETRSAILAMVIFIALYMVGRVFKSPMTVMSLVFVGVVVGAVVLNNVDLQESRITSQDTSEDVRIALSQWGVELLINQPLGYGFGADSVQLAERMFSGVTLLGVESDAPFELSLHNSLLNFTMVFGCVGLIAYAIMVKRFFVVGWLMAAGFMSYFVNTMVHNAGFLFKDIAILLLFSLAVHEAWRSKHRSARAR